MIKTKTLFVLLASALSLAACKKDTSQTESKKEEPKTFNDLKVSDSFNWSTNVDVTFNVEGIKQLSYEKNVMKVTSLDGKEIYFIGNYSMGDNISAKLNLPRVTKKVRVAFGSIIKVIDIENSKINFSYLPK